MKKSITPAQQKRINELLKQRREREIVKTLTKSQQIERLSMYEEDNYLRRDGLTDLQSKILSNYDRD